MAIFKTIEVCIGTDRSDGVRIRLSLLVMDGDAVLSEKYHSAMLMPGEDPAVLRANLETHLAQPTENSGIPGAPWPAIPPAEWAKVTGTVATFHTPAAIAKRNALVAAELARGPG